MPPSHLTERIHNAVHCAPKALSDRELDEFLAVTIAALDEMAAAIS